VNGPAPPLAGRRVLVTGGAGFIGTHVVRALVAAGATVTVADLRPSSEGGARSVVGDLTRPGAVDAALEDGTDAVVHLAAATSVLQSIERPVETFETNVVMTAALLERARAAGVASFVLASTNAAVGSGAGEGRIDEHATLRPLTPYGATKAAGEMLLSASTAVYGVRGVALRLTNVYGTDMVLKDSVVARIMRAAESGAAFEVYGDGRQVRDYVFVDDVVGGVLLGLTTDVSGPVVIGSGTSTSVLDLLDCARSATGRELDVHHVPPKSGEMAGVSVDNGLARSLGWQPTVGVAEGLGRVWAA
jgi:UDP-glucose 4-epimerase